MISLLENFYYYFKIKCIINQPHNGSVIVQFFDILRRASLIIIGSIFFAEKYTDVIYIAVCIMFIGSMIAIINFDNIIYYYEKYKCKSKTRYNIELHDIEIR